MVEEILYNFEKRINIFRKHKLLLNISFSRNWRQTR